MATSDNRPNPDMLLAQLREDAAAVALGKLRIYFGASAGVGKTFAMLSAAQSAKVAGQSVLVGLIVTVTGMELTAPYLSVTVAVKVSVVVAVVAPVVYAAWRAVEVGV